LRVTPAWTRASASSAWIAEHGVQTREIDAHAAVQRADAAFHEVVPNGITGTRSSWHTRTVSTTSAVDSA